MLHPSEECPAEASREEEPTKAKSSDGKKRDKMVVAEARSGSGNKFTASRQQVTEAEVEKNSPLLDGTGRKFTASRRKRKKIHSFKRFTC